jgi:hypothetical protein
MSGLSVLKLVTSKRQLGNSPQFARRQKLSTKLDEQIQLAKAQQSGEQFSPIKIRTIKDEVTGESRKVEVPKKLKPWWWAGENGKLCITIRYGARTLEIVEGKNAIETDSIADVITTLQLIRSAVDSGELDKRIDAVMGQVKAGFVKDTLTSGRPILKLPVKQN